MPTRNCLFLAGWFVVSFAASSFAFDPCRMIMSSSATTRRLWSRLLVQQNIGIGSRLFDVYPSYSTSTTYLSLSKGQGNIHLSNNFEAAKEQEKKRPRKKPTPNGKTFRADRVLANRGYGSRSECFDILKQRRVFQKFSDGEVFPVMGPSEKIAMDADIWIDGKFQLPHPPPLIRVYHKPKWVLSVMNDGKGRKNLGDLDFVHKMHPVGRLDYDTSGLLLFSSDGTLTQTLLHPSNQIQKEYVALVVGSANEDELRKILAAGVETSMGSFPAQLMEVKNIPADQVKKLIDDILSNLPPEYNVDNLEAKGYLFFKDAKELSEVRLVVEEGKHRMVRRILANSGFPVIGLKRERLGNIKLDDLKPGGYRELTDQEMEWAEALLKKKTLRKK